MKAKDKNVRSGVLTRRDATTGVDHLLGSADPVIGQLLSSSGSGTSSSSGVVSSSSLVVSTSFPLFSSSNCRSLIRSTAVCLGDDAGSCPGPFFWRRESTNFPAGSVFFVFRYSFRALGLSRTAILGRTSAAYTDEGYLLERLRYQCAALSLLRSTVS